jgi:hypothetical protein
MANRAAVIEADAPGLDAISGTMFLSAYCSASFPIVFTS